MTDLETTLESESGPPERRRNWLKRNSGQHPQGRYWCTWCGYETTDEKEIPQPSETVIDVAPVLCAPCKSSKLPSELPSARRFWQLGEALNPEPTQSQLDEISRLWAELYALRARVGFRVPGRKEEHARGPETKVKTWISIELVELLDKDDPEAKRLVEAGQKPERGAGGRYYEVTASSGEVLTGFLNGAGRATVNGVDPGTCKVAFPRVDPKRWEKARDG